MLRRLLLRRLLLRRLLLRRLLLRRLLLRRLLGLTLVRMDAQCRQRVAPRLAIDFEPLAFLVLAYRRFGPVAEVAGRRQRLAGGIADAGRVQGFLQATHAFAAFAVDQQAIVQATVLRLRLARRDRAGIAREVVRVAAQRAIGLLRLHAGLQVALVLVAHVVERGRGLRRGDRRLVAGGIAVVGTTPAVARRADAGELQRQRVLRALQRLRAGRFARDVGAHRGSLLVDQVIGEQLLLQLRGEARVAVDAGLVDRGLQRVRRELVLADREQAVGIARRQVLATHDLGHGHLREIDLRTARIAGHAPVVRVVAALAAADQAPQFVARPEAVGIGLRRLLLRGLLLCRLLLRGLLLRGLLLRRLLRIRLLLRGRDDAQRGQHLPIGLAGHRQVVLALVVLDRFARAATEVLVGIERLSGRITHVRRDQRALQALDFRPLLAKAELAICQRRIGRPREVAGDRHEARTVGDRVLRLRGAGVGSEHAAVHVADPLVGLRDVAGVDVEMDVVREGIRIAVVVAVLVADRLAVGHAVARLEVGIDARMADLEHRVAGGGIVDRDHPVVAVDAADHAGRRRRDRHLVVGEAGRGQHHVLADHVVATRREYGRALVIAEDFLVFATDAGIDAPTLLQLATWMMILQVTIVGDELAGVSDAFVDGDLRHDESLLADTTCVVRKRRTIRASPVGIRS